MSNYTQTLLDSRRRLAEQARALLDSAERENRSLTGEEERQFDKMGADLDSLKHQIDRITKMEADERSLADSMGELGGGRREESGDALIAQFRDLANGQRRSFDLMPSVAERRVLTEHRALTKGTASAGGNSVPTGMIPRLLEHLVETATLVNAGATVLTTNSGENLDIPITLTHGSAALVAEAGTIPQSDPTFGKRTLGSYKYGDLIIVSRELLEDSGVDLEGYLARQAGRAVGNALGAHLVTGTGAAQPTGIVTSATLGATSPTGTVGVPSFDTLMDLYYSVISPYRNSPEAGWLVKDSTVGSLRKLKDTTGRYLWEPSLTPGLPDTIFGKPVWTDPNVAATALNAKSVLFGDLSAYYVRIVNGIRFERSDDFRFDTDQVAFRCLVRADGILADQSGAVKYAVGAAT